MSLFKTKIPRGLRLSRLQPFLRDSGIFVALLGLTIVMTWPWILNIRDAVSDKGDPYLHTYFMWWDYHQTLRSPTNLFDASIFYPYQNTLAFSENDYGIAVLFFPLYALGIHPLTVFSVATLVAFAFSAYGMFRLARTLTGSTGAAWIAALVFAFVPYHFQRLPQLPMIFAGWIPLLFESVVLFAQTRSWKRAIWMGIAFLMNALTCVVWFTLTLVPFALAIIWFLVWFRGKPDRRRWFRGVVTLAVAFLLTTVFLYPYYAVHKTFGFSRSALDAVALSARPVNWLAVSDRNKLWQGMGRLFAHDELVLFPGLLPPLLAFVAVTLLRPVAQPPALAKWRPERFPISQRALAAVLDVLAFLDLLIALLAFGYNGFHLRIFGVELLRSSHAMRPLVLFAVTVCIRLAIQVPEFLRRLYHGKQLLNDLRANPSTAGYVLAIILLVTGFFGSLGMNFPFHRLLFVIILPFRSIRAPARWSMICYVGLALLAGWGTLQLTKWVGRRFPRVPQRLVYLAIAMLMLFEQRVAPIYFVKGDYTPSALTVRLRQTEMRAGLVELPAEKNNFAYGRYMVEAIHHRRPIVTAVSSFSPPIVDQIEALTLARPIPDSFLDLLERIPTSYLVVHNGLLNPESQEAIESFVERGLASGRLRFVNSYGEPSAADDLYAVSRIEPNAKTEATRQTGITFVRRQYIDILGREPEQAEIEQWRRKVEACGDDGSCVFSLRLQQNFDLLHSSEFHEKGGFVYSLYRALGRAPTYAEWVRDRKRLSTSNARALAAEWVAKGAFLDLYPVSLTNNKFVDKLIQAVGPISDPAMRDTLADNLTGGKIDRAGVLIEVITKSDAVLRDHPSFVTLCYFVFLKRDPDKGDVNYWTRILMNDPKGEAAVILGFLNSPEYRARGGSL